MTGIPSPGEENSRPADDGRQSNDDRASFARAIDVAYQVTTAAVMLALPMLLGVWLDKKFGTSPLFVLLGFVFGMVAGVTQLMRIVNSISRRHDKPASDAGRDRGSGDSSRNRNR